MRCYKGPVPEFSSTGRRVNSDYPLLKLQSVLSSSDHGDFCSIIALTSLWDLLVQNFSETHAYFPSTHRSASDKLPGPQYIGHCSGIGFDLPPCCLQDQHLEAAGNFMCFLLIT